MNTPESNDTTISRIVDSDGKALVIEKPAPAQPKKPLWRRLYGWIGTPAYRDTGLKDVQDKPLMEPLPFPQTYMKTFSHLPQATVEGAPIRGGVAATWTEPKSRREAKRHHQTKPVRYMVWWDRSLRRVDKIVKKQLASMTPDQQAEFIGKAMKGHAANG